MEKEKIAQVAGILDELDIDLWMIVERESGILSDPAMDFVVGTGVTWLSFFLFFRNGHTEAIVGNLDIEKIERLGLFQKVTAYKGSARDMLLASLDRFSPRRIALNYSVDSPTSDGLTYGKYLSLIELMKGTGYSERFVSAEPLIASLRGRKSGEEIARISKAIETTLSLFDRVPSFLVQGITEKALAEEITAERLKLGLEPAWEESHCPSVFAGPQKVGAHSGPTDSVFQKGHVFNIDFGVCYDKYCSDLQRTWYIMRDDETSPPEEVKRGFETLTKSIELAFERLKPGIKGVDVDAAAREFIISQGYEEYPHALGHQVGRSAHDGGALLGPAWERYGSLPFIPLEKDQVFTIEPRINLPGYGVVTVEDMVVITDTGARYLSTPQKEIYSVRLK